MSTTPLHLTTLDSTQKHTATVIFLHGLGDSASPWVQRVKQLCATPGLEHIKWILPTAPTRAVKVNLGAVMHAWFDLLSLDLDSSQDEEGMLASAQQINDIITSEIDSGINESRIILGGLSQGGTISLLTGLTSPRKLGGLIILSSRLVMKDKVESMASVHAKEIPLFWGHGDEDKLVRYSLGESAIAFLENKIGMKRAKALSPAGIHSAIASIGSMISMQPPPHSTEISPTGLTFKTYVGMGHTVCDEEWDVDVRAFVTAVLPEEEEEEG